MSARSPRTASPGGPEPAGSGRVNCPQCGEPVAWSESNRFRPFCSRRCRTLDLGAWASEAYRVPEPPAPTADGDD